MQKRNEKAQQLRVIQVEEGGYFVESGDGKVAYKCLVSDEKEILLLPGFSEERSRRSHFPLQTPNGHSQLCAGGCGKEGVPEKAPTENRRVLLQKHRGQRFCSIRGPSRPGPSKRHDLLGNRDPPTPHQGQRQHGDCQSLCRIKAGRKF